VVSVRGKRGPGPLVISAPGAEPPEAPRCGGCGGWPAWVCREAHPERSIGITGLRFPVEQQVFHVYATWNDWAFDHSGWSPESLLFMVNEDFEGRPLERVTAEGGGDALA
jgi:hypothetical protein